MIGFLRGIVVQKQPPHVVLDVNGVGYELEAPLSTCFVLPATGETVQLHTHLLVREDAHTLFGFATEGERRLFRALLKVSGVGARTALAVLSGSSVDGFIRSIEAGDTASLVRLPGVGRKTAERLVVELRDRLGAAAHESIAPVQAGQPVDARTEALNALLALGYKPPEARRMLDRVSDENLGIEDLLRAVLKQAAARV